LFGLLRRYLDVRKKSTMAGLKFRLIVSGDSIRYS
jgi:hypothetical protein